LFHVERDERQKEGRQSTAAKECPSIYLLNARGPETQTPGYRVGEGLEAGRSSSRRGGKPPSRARGDGRARKHGTREEETTKEHKKEYEVMAFHDFISWRGLLRRKREQWSGRRGGRERKEGR